MKKRTSSLPLLVIVAAIALVLGSFGTATAAGLTKGKVKAIANKVVTKRAPTLSVAFAANAGNASNLNGLPASAYQNRIGFTSTQVTGAAVPLAANTAVQLVGPLSLTVPAGVNFVHVIGAATISGGASTYVYWLEQDAVCSITGPHINDRYFGEYSAQDTMTVNFVFQATPGAHVYRLCGLSAVASTVFTRSLSAETSAVGATGGATIARPADGGADNDLTTPR